MATESKGTNFYKIGQQMGASQLDTGTADILSGIGKQLTSFGSVMSEERKAEAKKLKEERKLAGDKVSQAFTDMGETLSQLPQESYRQAQDEVEDLRYRMYECIDAKDTKCQQDLMLELNQIKQRHAGDADNLKTFVDSWQKDEDGNMPVSTDAMSEEDVKLMENFVANDSKRTVYEDGKMYYEWDMDTGEVDEKGDPITELKKVSLQDLQDKVILKDTVNGNKYLDLEAELKQKYIDTQKPPSKGEMKRRVGEIIPRDEKAIRDWLHGNPAEQHDLDVERYLIDLMDRDFGTFGALGIDLTKPEYAKFDKDNNGVTADEVPDDFKTQLVENVMNVKDLEVTHSILTDIYAARGFNSVLGIEYKEDETVPGGYVGNKNYNTENESILGMGHVDPSAEDAKNRDIIMEKLTALADPKNLEQYKSMTVDAIASKIGIDPKAQVLNPKTGEAESVATYIANAKNKKAETQEKTKIDW